MLHTRNAVKAQNCRVRFFPQNNSINSLLCTFTRFGESGFGESGLNLGRLDRHWISSPSRLENTEEDRSSF